ncbi:uncharacterized protein LOC144356709 [Saccoglossus kowalevskii]
MKVHVCLLENRSQIARMKMIYIRNWKSNFAIFIILALIGVTYVVTFRDNWWFALPKKHLFPQPLALQSSSNGDNTNAPTRPDKQTVTVQEKKEFPDTYYPLPDIRTYIPNFYTKLSPKDAKKYLNNETTMVYLHHHKAGGKYMIKCLTSAHDKMPFPTGFAHLTLKDWEKWRNSRTPNTNDPIELLVCGGMAFGACEFAQSHHPCSYITILREPYDRMYSLYNHCHKSPGDWICSRWDISELAITDLAIYTGSHFFHQVLTNPSICGGNKSDEAYAFSATTQQWKPHGKSCSTFRTMAYLKYYLNKSQKEELLEYVIENLENWFTVIGMQDEIVLSLQMIERAYQRPVYQVCKNSSKRNPPPPEQVRNKDEKIKELKSDPRVYDALYYDIRIYEAARKIFNRQISKFNNSVDINTGV